MTKRVFITRRIPDAGMTILKNKGYEIDVRESEALPTQDEIIESLNKKPYDAVMTLLTDKIDAKIFDAVPNIKMFANYATGFNNLDLVEAKKRGIYVTNAQGNYAGCIAEHTVALILGLTTRMVEADRFMRAGKYQGWSPMNFVGVDLSGKTVGLVGAGKIGEQVAKHLKHGFDMKVLYSDVVKNEKLENEYGATFVSLDQLLAESDIVSLHVPLLESTKHLINAERLAKMKPTAYLINTARGPVVDENALVAALKKGTIKGAGLDVFEFEPQMAEGLAQLENVVLTPHIASARDSARNEMAEIAANNIIDFFEGRKPRNLVNA